MCSPLIAGRGLAGSEDADKINLRRVGYAEGASLWEEQRQERKRFFFEKKNQKTFIRLG